MNIVRSSAASVLAITLLAFAVNDTRAQEDKGVDIAAKVKKVLFPSKKGGTLIGTYFKPVGLVDAAKINNARYLIMGPECKLGRAIQKGNEMWVEFEVASADSVRAIGLDNLIEITEMPKGDKAVTEKIGDADKTLQYGEGTIVIHFLDVKSLTSAPKKK